MKLIFDLSANGLNCTVCKDSNDGYSNDGLCIDNDVGESMECKADDESCLFVECKYFFAITDRFNNLNPK